MPRQTRTATFAAPPVFATALFASALFASVAMAWTPSKAPTPQPPPTSPVSALSLDESWSATWTPSTGHLTVTDLRPGAPQTPKRVTLLGPTPTADDIIWLADESGVVLLSDQNAYILRFAPSEPAPDAAPHAVFPPSRTNDRLVETIRADASGLWLRANGTLYQVRITPTRIAPPEPMPIAPEEEEPGC